MSKIISTLGLIALLAGCGPETTTVSIVNSQTSSLESKLDQEREIMSKKRKIEEKYHLSISYDVDQKGTSQFLDHIETVLGQIHPTLLGYLEHIQIGNEKCKNYQDNYCEGGQPIYTAPKTGRIQISPRRPFDADLLAHALGHIVSAKEPPLQKGWNEMIGLDPTSGEYRAIKQSAKPTKGFLSEQGVDISYDPNSMTTSWEEDLGSYLAAIYQRDSPFARVESNQNLYLLKLNFLIERDLISRVQYEKARVELGTDLTKAN